MSIDNSALKKSIVRSIKGSRRKRVILFTDIEGSSAYWEKKGDLHGRLMVDAHNRLLFPVIEKFHGKVLKTIGDSIMASFRTPKNALKAAVAMQQVLKKKSEVDSDFSVKVRMGLHYGKTLVEPSDLFGDSVNLAARIEGMASGGEILVSEDFAKKVDQKKFVLKEKGEFQPRGKSEKVKVLACVWQDYPEELYRFRASSFFQMSKRQRVHVLFSVVLAGVAVAWLLWYYLRFILFDQDRYFGALAKSLEFAGQKAAIGFSVLSLVFVASLVFLVIRSKKSEFMFRFCRGLTGFLVVSVLAHSVFSQVQVDLIPFWQTKYFQSVNMFAEPQEKQAEIFAGPGESQALRKVFPGELFLIQDQQVIADVRWLKMLSIEESVWAPEWVPAKIGEPAIHLFKVRRFTIWGHDLLALGLGLLAFLFGFFTFRIEPF